MRKNLLLLICCLIIFPLQFAAKPSIPPPPIHVEDGWDKNEDGDRSFSSSPSLFKDANFVYVYSEKQLDNLTIGITDPLILYGNSASNSNLCHYWICDGYKINKVQYAAYMIDRDFDEYNFFSGMTDILSEYFHYNMGTGSNAWFYQDTPVYNGDNYTANRKIHVVTPNTNQ